MRDLFIVLPGIMGSILERDDKDLWNPRPGMARKLLRHKKWVESLEVVGTDDPENTGWLDDVVPVGFAQSNTIVPGLFSIDGYTELRAALDDAFGAKLIEGDPLEPRARRDKLDPATEGVPNYYEFAYDWRRDLRASSLRLHQLIEIALPALRNQRQPEAKVVFIAHSMGGLVARYYLEGINPTTGEHFEGWRNVRELLTFGTPYLGSLDALQHLVEGFKVLFVNFSSALRTYNGVYQLLPRYKCVSDGRSWKYPHELTGLADFDKARATQAFQDFHEVIEKGVERHRSIGEYPRYHVVPHIGFGHLTLNSAEVDGSGIRLARALPAEVDAAYAGGDGTVPAVSAIPIEYMANGDFPTIRYSNQKHGSLQADHRVLAQEIVERLRKAQGGTKAIRDGGSPWADAGQTKETVGAAHLSIDHARYWLEGQTEADGGLDDGVTPGSVTITLHNTPGNAKIEYRVVNLDSDGDLPNLKSIEPGVSVPLPSAAGEYRIDAYCTSANLESSSGFAILAEE